MKTKLFLFAALVFFGSVLLSCQKDEEMNSYASENQTQLDLKNTYAEDHDFQLDPISNFPDPFSKTTTIRYHLKINSKVRLVAYKADETWFKLLVDEIQPAGNHEVVFDGTGLPAGEYIAQLNIGKHVYYEKMTKLKEWQESANSILATN